MKTLDSNASGASPQELAAQYKPNPARPINRDQVSWMLSAIGRYLPPSNYPAVSRAREIQKFALLYEIMEVAHLHFEDDGAQHNGTPPDVRRFRFASKNDEALNHAVGSLIGAGAKQQGHGTNGDVTFEETTWGGDTIPSRRQS